MQTISIVLLNFFGIFYVIRPSILCFFLFYSTILLECKLVRKGFIFVADMVGKLDPRKAFLSISLFYIRMDGFDLNQHILDSQ